MACDDRQLSEAQRQAGFQQQRTGVMRAVRPFSGPPTLDNLIDYMNRELIPAVKQSREKVNDVYLQVTDNAPSANPLGYYFATDTTNGDPTGGRIRLDSATQNAATTVRVSQVNGRSEDVLSWLDVMNGGATAPLGVITLFDAINPGRFLRFDLTSMTDQGPYWDLGVTPIESSHDSPFVEGEAVVVSFIAGVASAGATVPPGLLTPIGANTVLGNPTASTAPPTEIAIPAMSVMGRSSANIVTYTLSSPSRFFRGNTAYAPGVGATGTTPTALGWGVLTQPDLPFVQDGQFYLNTFGLFTAPLARNLSSIGRSGFVYDAADYTFDVLGSDSVVVDAGTGQVQRAALAGGDVTASQNSNVLTVEANAITDGKLRDSAALSVIGRAVNSIGDPADIVASANDRVLLRRANTLTFDQIVDGDIAAGTITLGKITGIAANTVLGNNTGTPNNPLEIAVGTNSVLGRVGANIVAAPLVNSQMANMAAGTVKGQQIDAATGAPVDLTGLELAELLRYGTTQATTLVATANDFALNADTTVLRVTPTGAQTLTGITGGAQGRLLFVENIAGSGNNLTIASLSASSLTANRIRTPQALDMVVGFRETALLRWETNNNDWRVVARSMAGFALTDGDKGDVTVSASGATWTIDNSAVTLAKMANLAAGTTIGRQIDASTGAPVALTGSEQGENIRLGLREDFSPAPATYNDFVIDARTKVVRINPSSNGDVIITGFALGASNSDAYFTLLIIGGDGRVILKNEDAGSVAANRILTPFSADYILTRDRDGCRLEYIASRWTPIERVQVLDGDKGDITVSSSGATYTIDNDVVTNAKLRDSAALSVIGRSVNSSGDPADIAAGSDGHVLRRSGTALGFGTIATAGIADAAVTLAKQADLAQSRIIGRAEGAGTGVPTALTPTQVVSIIDGESPTWTASHRFDSFVQFGSSTGLPVSGDIRKALSLRVVTGEDIELVASDDILLDAVDQVTLDGIQLNLTASNQIVATVGNAFTINSSATVTVSATTSMTVSTENFILASGGFCLDDVVTTTTATENNFSVAGANVARFNGTTTLTGMVASRASQLAVIVNAHVANVLAIEDDHSGSSAANRFALDTSTRWVRPNSIALAWYDGTSARWRLITGDRTFTL
jgi:hypothetical protein